MKVIITDHSTDKVYRPKPATVELVLRGCNGYSRLATIIDLAIKHWYGSSCFFWRDYGLRDVGIYGQVCKPLPPDYKANNCITPRIRLNVSINGQDVCSNQDLIATLG